MIIGKALIAPVVAAVALVGCGGSSTSPATPPTASRPARSAVVYAPDASGERLAPTRIDVATAGDPLTAALTALFASGRPPMPPGVSLRSVAVADGVATVSLSDAFERGYPAGSASEVLVVGAIVGTVTASPGIRAVRITIQGRAPEPVGAQFDFSRPLTRADLPSGVVPGP